MIFYINLRKLPSQYGEVSVMIDQNHMPIDEICEFKFDGCHNNLTCYNMKFASF